MRIPDRQGNTLATYVVQKVEVKSFGETTTHLVDKNGKLEPTHMVSDTLTLTGRMKAQIDAGVYKIIPSNFEHEGEVELESEQPEGSEHSEEEEKEDEDQEEDIKETSEEEIEETESVPVTVRERELWDYQQQKINKQRDVIKDLERQNENLKALNAALVERLKASGK